MAFGRSTNAVAMMGNGKQVASLMEILKDTPIRLLKRNFNTADELIAEIKQKIEIEYVFLSDEGFLSERDGKYEIPLKVANAKDDITIVILFTSEKKDDSYINWAVKSGIELIYFMDDPEYTDEDGFRFDLIIEELKAKKRVYTKAPEILDEDEEDEPLLRGKPQVIKVPVPVEKVVEKKVVIEKPVEVIVEKEVVVEKPVEVIVEKPVGMTEEDIKKVVKMAIGSHMKNTEPAPSPITTEQIKEAVKDIVTPQIQATIKDTLKEQVLPQQFAEPTPPPITPITTEQIKEAVKDIVTPQIQATIKDTLKEQAFPQLTEQTPQASTFNQAPIPLPQGVPERPEKVRHEKVIESAFVKGAADGTLQRITDYSRKRCICIGVFNLSPGAGSTASCIMLAEQLSSAGYTTCVVAFDGKDDLSYVPQKKAIFKVPKEGETNRKGVLFEAREQAEFVVIDFGSCMELTPQGDILALDKEAYEELLRCQYKLCMGFADSWNIGKINWFVNKDDYSLNETYVIALSSLSEMRSFKRLEDSFGLKICKRDSDKMLEAVFNMIGLT